MGLNGALLVVRVSYFVPLLGLVITNTQLSLHFHEVYYRKVALKICFLFPFPFPCVDSFYGWLTAWYLTVHMNIQYMQAGCQLLHEMPDHLTET